MEHQKVLVPYNFTPYDRKALDFLVRVFLNLKDCEITLFHAYTPVPEMDMRQSPVMERIRENLNYLEGKIVGLERALRQAKDYLLENGFREEQIRIEFRPRKKDPAGEIIEAVRSERFDMIVINHKPGKVTRLFTGSVFSKVVNSLKDTTVCIVS